MSNLSDAFAHFGVAGKNPRWSWSARSDDGKTVVITLWKDFIHRDEAGLFVYDEIEEAQAEDDAWLERPGNRERLENLIWARDHCDGDFRVIIIVAKDEDDDPREIVDSYPQDKLRMRITDLDDRGRFRAVQADK